MVLFFKQQTSYDMRISDWSSDVCSTDLGILAVYAPLLVWRDEVQDNVRMAVSVHGIEHGRDAFGIDGRPVYTKGLAECPHPRMRSEERRVGNECVRPFRTRWSPYR